MIPERKADGLENEALLHRVDAIVWTEGGDATGPALPKRADDVHFWRSIMSELLSGKKFYFKPCGSKLEAQKIARLVSANNLERVVVCMDRDHDWLSGVLIIDSNVIYTRWYSWENEVWTPENVAAAFRIFHAGNDDAHAADDVLASQSRHIEQRLRWHVRADLLGELTDSRYLSNSRRRILSVRGENLPEILVQQIKRARPRDHIPRIRLKSRQRKLIRGFHQHCIGHLIADFYFHTLRWLLRRYCNEPHLTFSAARTVMVEVFRTNCIRNRTESRKYYRAKLRKLRLG